MLGGTSYGTFAKESRLNGSNFVEDLAAAFGENAELALSGVVVLLLRRSVPFRNVFLNWLEDETGLAIQEDQDWVVFGERPVAGRTGFVDIVLASPTLEIWIESKTNSRVKAGQLRRFVEESHRHMHDALSGIEAAAHPLLFNPVPGRPKVAVAVISGREQRVPSELLPWRDAFPALGCGFCWAGDAGYLRWSALMLYLEKALPLLDRSDRLITRDLIEWWGVLSRSWSPPHDP